ncbi:Hypothetical predicted protein [Pelobates cultripes]|uniref:Uncharacterized protein n=1 Tax=Pelobates cultripes TaxID=61616 RepID=A0AAD1SH55_PELCU
MASQSGKQSNQNNMADTMWVLGLTQTSQVTTLDRIVEDFWAKLNRALQALSSPTPGCNSPHKRPPSTQPPPMAKAPRRRHHNKHPYLSGGGDRHAHQFIDHLHDEQLPDILGMADGLL